ncbi:MAG TPA: DUF2062 domain-containing protein [Bacteroidales bacterium]
MNLLLRIPVFYKTQISNLILYCSRLDPRKTALAVALALCLGSIPLFGFTFILATTFGLVFRLNQFIIQSVHILASPLQFILFYPFIRTGQFVFQLEDKFTLSIKQVPGYLFNHTGEFIHEYLKVILAATGVWFLVSIVAGYIVFRIVYLYFSRINKLKKSFTLPPHTTA